MTTLIPNHYLIAKSFLWQVENRIRDVGIQVGSRSYSTVEDPIAVVDIFVRAPLACTSTSIDNFIMITVNK